MSQSINSQNLLSNNIISIINPLKIVIIKSMIENDKEVITEFQELKPTDIDKFLQISHNDIEGNDQPTGQVKNHHQYLASILQSEIETNRNPYYCHPKYRKNYYNISQLTNKKKILKVQDKLQHTNGKQQFQWMRKLEQLRKGTYNIPQLLKKTDNSLIFKSSGFETKQEFDKKKSFNKFENSDADKKGRYDEEFSQMNVQESEVQLPQLNLYQRTSSKDQSIKQLKSQIMNPSQKQIYSQTYTTAFYSTKSTNQHLQNTQRNHSQDKSLLNSKTCSKSLVTGKKIKNKRQSYQSQNSRQNSLHKKDIIRRTQNKVVSAFNADYIIKEHRANNLKDIERKLRSNLARNTQYNSNKLPSSQSRNAASPFLKKQISNKDIKNFNPNILVRQFNKKCGYAINTKVFIFNSQDNYIKNILVNWGWIQNPVIQSPFYNFKWTYLPNTNDFNCQVRADQDQYSIIQRENKRNVGNISKQCYNQQFYNHFNTTHELTSKAFLSKNLKQNQNLIGNINSYFPLCYDLGNAAQSTLFQKSYREIFMLGLLQTYYQFILENYGQITKIWKKHYITKYLTLFKVGNYTKYLQFSKCIFLKSQFKAIHFQNLKKNKSDIPINMPLSITALKYWRNRRKKHQKQYEINLDYKFEKVDKEHFLKFNEVVFLKQFDCLEIAVEKGYLFKHDSTSIEAFKKQLYAAPSEIFMRQIVKQYVFHSIYQLYKNGNLPNNFKQTDCQLCPLNPCFGSKNLWIVKPSGNARGSGIKIYNKYKDIIEKSKAIQSRIVQKYIQKPLIINNRNYPQIFNKKFDIRQWVLVKNIDPLEIYMFSKCYIRICSEQYICKDFGNLKRHLTNYSLNKQKFIEDRQQSQSVINSDQFAKILQSQFNISWKQSIQPQIQKIILKSILACQENLYGDLYGENQMSCFQLFGYDILLDQKFNAWLLEVNLSPACEQRTPWIKQWLNQMGTGLLKIVLPSELLPEGNQNQNILFKDDSNQWTPLDMNEFEKDLDWQLLLFKDYQFQKPTHTDLGLQIVGQKINTGRILKQTKKYMQKLSIDKICQYLKSFPLVINQHNLKKKHAIETCYKYFSTLKQQMNFTTIQKKIGVKTVENYFKTVKIESQFKKLATIHNIKKIQFYFNVVQRDISIRKTNYQWFFNDIRIISNRENTIKCLKKIGQGKQNINTIQFYFKRKLFYKNYQSQQILKYLKSSLQQVKYQHIDLPKYHKKINTLILQKYFHTILQASHTHTSLQTHNTKTIQKYIRILPQLQNARLKKIIQFQSNVSRIWRVLKRKKRKQCFLFLKDVWKRDQRQKNIEVIEKYMRKFLKMKMMRKQEMRRLMLEYQRNKSSKKQILL